MFFPMKVLAIKSSDKATYLQIATSPEISKEMLKYNAGNGILGEIRIEDGRHRTGRQNRFIHALIRDIAMWHCEDPTIEKRFMFYWWCALNEKDYSSTTQLNMEDANSFIDFLLEFIIEHGIHTDHPILEELVKIKDISKYLYYCLKHRKCAICGKNTKVPGTGGIHHWDTIGMGNNRYKLDDSKYRKICLCPIHHAEAETLGNIEFGKKHKVFGIQYKDVET